MIDRVKYQKASGHQGSSTKTSMKLSKTNLKQLQRANQGSNHPDKNYTLEKFLFEELISSWEGILQLQRGTSTALPRAGEDNTE